MASASSSNVTVLRQFQVGEPNGKAQTVIYARLTGGTFGGTTNTIPASAFGLTKIEECSSIFVDDSQAKAYGAAPGYGGATLLLYDLEQATDANRMLPADVTLSSVILEGYVKGY